MKPKEFKGMNCVFAKNQGKYLPLLAHRNAEGVVTSYWSMSFWERMKVLFTGGIYVQLLTFNKPLQPLGLIMKNPLNLKQSRFLPEEKEEEL